MQSTTTAYRPMHFIRTILCFSLAELLMALYIVHHYWLYPSVTLMISSWFLAALPWVVTIAGAILTLGERRYQFLDFLSQACLLGAIALQSYYILYFLPVSGWSKLLLPVVLYVVAAAGMFYRAVKINDIPLKWLGLWLTGMLLVIILHYLFLVKQ